MRTSTAAVLRPALLDAGAAPVGYCVLAAACIGHRDLQIRVLTGFTISIAMLVQVSALGRMDRHQHPRGLDDPDVNAVAAADPPLDRRGTGAAPPEACAQQQASGDGDGPRGTEKPGFQSPHNCVYTICTV